MVIPGFDQYDISEDGVVTEIATGKVCKQTVCKYVNGNNFVQVSLRKDNGDVTTRSALRLLALAYKPRDDYHNMVVVPKDGDGTNISIDNIQWKSRVELSKEKYNKNQARRTSKLCSPETVENLHNAMCALDEPMTMAELSSLLEVPYSTVRYSMIVLVQEKLVRRTRQGYEVIK